MILHDSLMKYMILVSLLFSGLFVFSQEYQRDSKKVYSFADKVTPFVFHTTAKRSCPLNLMKLAMRITVT